MPRVRGVARRALDLDTAWLAHVDPAVVRTDGDPFLSAVQLDQLDAVLTGAVVGIADTGTVVLDHVGPGQGDGSSRWCRISTSAWCWPTRSLPRCPTRCRGSTPSRPQTWISGPRPPATSSSTGSKECTVHGRCTSSSSVDRRLRPSHRHARRPPRWRLSCGARRSSCRCPPSAYSQASRSSCSPAHLVGAGRTTAGTTSCRRGSPPRRRGREDVLEPCAQRRRRPRVKRHHQRADPPGRGTRGILGPLGVRHGRAGAAGRPARRCGVVATLGEDQQRILVVEVAGQVGDRLDCIRCAGGGCRVDELAKAAGGSTRPRLGRPAWCPSCDDAEALAGDPGSSACPSAGGCRGPGASAQHDHGVRRTGTPSSSGFQETPSVTRRAGPILRCPHDDAEADAEYVVVSPLESRLCSFQPKPLTTHRVAAAISATSSAGQANQREVQQAHRTKAARHPEAWRSRPPPSGREAAPG